MDLVSFPPAEATDGKRYKTKFMVLVPGESLKTSDVYRSILSAKPPQNVAKMLRTIRTAMDKGLPLHNTRKCELLKGPVFELKAKTGKGPELRVFGFRDDHRIVLCECNPKKRGENPKPMIEKVEKFRDDYFKTKKSGQLTLHHGNPKDL